MKFLAFAWWTGIQDRMPSVFDPSEQYQTHLEAIDPRLTPGVRTLARDVNMHDGELTRLAVSPIDRSATLRVRTWGEATPATIEIRDQGVAAFELLTNGRDGLPGPGGMGDIRYYEVDIVNDGFTHRILCSTGVELHVAFRDVEVLTVDDAA